MCGDTGFGGLPMQANVGLSGVGAPDRAAELLTWRARSAYPNARVATGARRSRALGARGVREPFSSRGESAMAGLGPVELIVILVIVLVIFGAGRLSRIGGELGSAIKGFREAIRPEDERN